MNQQLCPQRHRSSVLPASMLANIFYSTTVAKPPGVTEIYSGEEEERVGLGSVTPLLISKFRHAFYVF
jgi:hypothetical protein